MNYSRTVQETFNGDDTVTVTGRCIVTQKEHSVTVPAKGYYDWREGRLIQDAMPNVSSDDREFLISGTSPEGWDTMFGKDR